MSNQSINKSKFSEHLRPKSNFTVDHDNACPW